MNAPSLISSHDDEIIHVDFLNHQGDSLSLIISDTEQVIPDDALGQDELLPAYFVSTGGIRGNSHFHLMGSEEDISKVELDEEVTESDIQEDLQDGIEMNQDMNELSQWSSIQSMLSLVNNERKRVGAKPLCLNKKLSSAAQAHTNDMITRNFFSHTGSDGSIVSNRVNRFRYKWNSLAENIAINGSVSGAHKAFMKSSGHRKNVLNPKLTQIGIGGGSPNSGKYKGRLYVTQVFAQSNTEGCG